MRIFYQLSVEEQDAAVQHCVDMILSQAVEHGLNLEVIDPNDKEEAGIKDHIDSLLAEVRGRTDIDDLQKTEMLMSDEEFGQTIYDLATEMANNAFYHQNDELVIFDDVIDKTEDVIAALAPESEAPEEMPKSKKDMLN